MAGVIAGMRGTGTSHWATGELPTTFREMILWRNPDGDTPFTALLSKVKKQSTSSYQFNWFEEEQGITRLTVNTVTTTTITTLTATDSNALHLKAGDYLLVEAAITTAYANEIVQVAVTPTTTNTISVTRGAQGTTAATTATTVTVLVIGSAYAEGSDAPDPTTRYPTPFYNYTQIFKDTYSLSGSAEVEETRTGDPVKNEKTRKMYDHATRMEWAFLFGKRSVSAGTTLPMRTTDGVLNQLATAYAAGYTNTMKIWATAVTIEDWGDAIYKVFDYNVGGGAGNSRLIICGNGYLNSINKMIKMDAATQVQFDGKIDFFGMSLRRLETPQGTFYLKTHPLMNQHTTFTDCAFVLDMSGFYYRPKRNRDTKTSTFQVPGRDAKSGLWQTEAGLEMHHHRTMQFQYGLQAPAAA